jgi:Uma2 family endonuclease
MTLEQFQAAEAQEGYRYELIDGRLYVSPEANFPEHWVEDWLCSQLRSYAAANPKVINFVTARGRVFVPDSPEITTPEPDILAYKNFPRRRPKRDIRWQDISPLLVAEVLSADDPGKDLIRNVALYLQVPSIKEYWILDARQDADFPAMTTYHRRGRHWQEPIEIGPNETYTTSLLPGFQLTMDTSD